MTVLKISKGVIRSCKSTDKRMITNQKTNKTKKTNKKQTNTNSPTKTTHANDELPISYPHRVSLANAIK